MVGDEDCFQDDPMARKHVWVVQGQHDDIQRLHILDEGGRAPSQAHPAAHENLRNLLLPEEAAHGG